MEHRVKQSSSSVFHITGLEHEITLLREVLGETNSIRHNSPDVIDEMVTKLYGTKKV